MIPWIAWTLMTVALPAASLPEQPSLWHVTAQEGWGGRVLFVPDPVLARLVEDPAYTPDWPETAPANEKGEVKHPLLRNGWAYAETTSPEATVCLLEGRGFRTLYLNGEAFAGDFYSRGFLRIVVPLKAGKNRWLVRAFRGGFSLRVSPAEGPASISPRDPLLPDLREGKLLNAYGAVVILNHRGQPLEGATLEVGDNGVLEKVRVPLDPILPYGLAKPPFPLRQWRDPKPTECNPDGTYPLRVTLSVGVWRQTLTFPLRVRPAEASYKVTRLSQIDGSAQYYAVRPPVAEDPKKSYALYLTLHGAGVEATSQVDAYTPKRDGYLVAPTNRRPFGFDWQEWGRLDALETLEHFLAKHPIDPARVYLTGHSMGGHGTWYLGVLYPSRFAAIAPSAGWISFSTYTRKAASSEENPALAAFRAAGLESDTLAFLRNTTHLPIYILHGEKDDNVPVRESRRMVEALSAFHKDFVYHEQPGAGHWWGNDCVDWVPLFEFLRRHVNPPAPARFEFSTPNPAIASTYAWATIGAQQNSDDLSRIQVEADPRRGTVQIQTHNVWRLRLRLAEVLPQSEVRLQIDGTELRVSTEAPVWFIHESSGWSLAEDDLAWSKGFHRNGPFKLAFDCQMVWVVGTQGTPEENAAWLAKVRYDAQVWWYRGNGNVRVIPDTQFDPRKYRRNNVILYGNADTNAAFATLLEGCPIQVGRDKVQVGERVYSGDVGVLFAYPRRDSDLNLVGVVGATSVRAARFSQPARYFISGVACPDYVVFGDRVLTEGLDGVLESGFFDNLWQLRDGGS